MQLSLQNFSSLVATMAASVQGACSSLVNLGAGSVTRAMLEASASVALWLQYIALQVLSMTRLATSAGDDADSWVQDFGMQRLSAVPATGYVVMSSLNPGSQSAVVPTGATVRTSDGSQTFSVINGPYHRSLGEPAVTVEVQAVAGGSQGNIQPGVITVLGTAIPGIDTVANTAPFTGGKPAEADAALRARFVSFINTRSQATVQALGYAVSSVQQGLTFTILEGVTLAGVAMPGHVQIIIDDGSGKPNAVLIAQVAAAVDLVRPVGTSVSVSAPTLVNAVVGAVVVVDSTTDVGLVTGLVNDAVSTFVNGLGVGQSLRISRIPGLCYDASDAVLNVQNITVNDDTQDIGGTSGTVVRISSMNIIVHST